MSYVGPGDDVIKPYTWLQDTIDDVDEYYFKNIVSPQIPNGTVVKVSEAHRGSDIDYF